MPEIETFKTVYVTLDLATGTASFPLNIEFEVDEMVLKYFTLFNDNGVTGSDGPEMTLLYTDLLNSYLISFPLTTVMFETLKTSFKIPNKRVQGSYNFTAYSSTGAMASYTNITISFALMFIKYKA